MSSAARASDSTRFTGGGASHSCSSWSWRTGALNASEAVSQSQVGSPGPVCTTAVGS